MAIQLIYFVQSNDLERHAPSSFYTNQSYLFRELVIVTKRQSRKAESISVSINLLSDSVKKMYLWAHFYKIDILFQQIENHLLIISIVRWQISYSLTSNQNIIYYWNNVKKVLKINTSIIAFSRCINRQCN